MRRVLIAIVSLLVAGSALLPAPTPVFADPIADKRKEAERLAEALETRAERVAVLAEEFNVARIEAERVDALVADAEARLTGAAAQVGAARDRLREQSVTAYMHSGSAPALSMLAQAKRIEDMAIRQQYARSATASTAEAIDELRAAQSSLADERSSLTDVQASAHVALDDVGKRRAEAESAADAQRRLLGRVKGELSTLVAAEAKRRADEAARQARADVARRQAREAASRRATAPTTTAVRPAATTTTTARPTSTSPPPTPPPTSSGAEAAVAEARRQLGKPYHYGGSGPNSFDCSGLTSWSWNAGGVTLPHSSRAQWSATRRIAIGDLAPGDIVFYGNPIYHVGLYVGGGDMIEASETGTPVRQTTIFRKDLVGAGRVSG